jgi:Zn finger protein HypA/HybF involved in hydrogenase expression
MSGDEQHLDGNAAGGVLEQIFALEMTTVQVICANCNTVGLIGAALVYATAMGTIIRCPGCGKTMMRIAHGPQRYWVDFSGTRLMQLAMTE